MYPVLFSFGGYKLYSFAFFYNIVIAVCAVPVALEMERLGWKIPPTPFFLKWVPKSWQGTYYFHALYICAFSMLVGLGGAHLLFGISMTFLQAWGKDYSFYTWLFMFAANLNGSMWFGGFLACLFLIRYFAKTQGVRYIQFIDVGIFAPILGQVPGRIACFLGGCCYGKPSNLPWAFAQDTKFSLAEFSAGTPLHPSQLYESLLALMIFTYMWMRRRSNIYVGQNFVRYFVLTGIARFFTEMVRADTPRGVVLDWLTVSQVVALGCAIVGGVFHFWVMKKKTLAPSTA